MDQKIGDVDIWILFRGLRHLGPRSVINIVSILACKYDIRKRLSKYQLFVYQKQLIVFSDNNSLEFIKYPLCYILFSVTCENIGCYCWVVNIVIYRLLPV